MHVAIDAHLLSGRPGYRSAGVHRYIDCLLRHVRQADARVRYTVLVGREGVCPDPLLPVRQARWPTERAAVRAVWEQTAQPWLLRRIGADLVHAPVFVAPIAAPCPSVVTIHDLSFLRFPQLFRPANRLYLRIMTRLSTQRARRIIAVSRHAAEETTRLLGIGPERINVVYHGVDPAFRPISRADVEAFRQRAGLPARYALFVGTLEPRKNLARLVEAFARVRDDTLHLVLAGGKGWFYDELYARVETLGLQHAVTFAGYVPQEDLPLWYNAATAFVYPSLYEGFGLPVVEAQACGVPVLTSDVSSLPEAAGGASVLVDPYDVEALAAGLQRLLQDQPLREGLREAGLTHAQRFTWPKAAWETTRVYWQAIASGGAT
ncbi:MAG: glycosyltransferase family 4 protein [Anaerolineales bacterium]|nr:glycosyltransferase family 4 protein [Anaerolineales bacterium]